MIKLIASIKKDKLLHFIFGVLIFLFFQGFVSYVISLSIVLFIAILKEAYDKVSGTGTPELMDIVFTIVGGLIAWLLI